MSIYDKASLVQIPSGYKGGTLYSVVPNDADGDFTYSGGTNGTRVNKDGLIETIAADTPRLNYPLLNGVVQSNPTLLLEPQRINIYTYSEDLSQGTTLTNTSVDETSIVSPDGALTGNKLTQTSGAYLRKNLSVILSGTYAWSFFAKKGDLRYLNARSLFVLNGTTPANGNTIIDLDTNTIAYKGTNVTSATIEQYPNDWIKVEIVATDNATGSGDFVDFFFTDSDTSTQSTGVAGNGYIWGVQFESGIYPTSYIKTQGEVNGVTRGEDDCIDAQTDFNDAEGVLYVNAKINDPDDADDNDFSLGDGSFVSNSVEIAFRNPLGLVQTIVGKCAIDGSTLSLTNTTITDQSIKHDLFHKVAYQYKQADFKMFVNGFKIGTSTYNDIFASGVLSRVSFEGNGTSSTKFRGETKELMTFNSAMTDIELETLTSYRSFNSMAKELLFTIE